ncbi:MAG: hypothetical protein KGH78_04195, partial [Candidatus Micrarchaeota archaeon]|nr:hypothetical protein [Candidatus Micrarchaeota archaeon]
VNQTEQEIMRNSEIQTLQVLRDGMHRSTLTKASGTTIHTININGSEASATSVPLEHDSTVLTSGKPERREDRYLGFNPDSWLDFKGVGIDG